MFSFPNKATLVAYTNGTNPKTGIHTVENDEEQYNTKTEYLFNNSVLTLITNVKVNYVKLTPVNTKALIATTYPTPSNKEMVVVLTDETVFNKTTWYTYNVDKWIFMGEYTASKIEKAISAGGTRGAVIKENTNFTIPLEYYVVGRSEISIYISGMKLTSTDFTEVGTVGTRSKIVQFKKAILDGSEIEFIREVHNNEALDATFYLNQTKIQDDAIFTQRVSRFKELGFTYGGTIQACTLKDYSKVYYCTVNEKFYIPKIKSVVGNMTAPTTGSLVASASSEHAAPFPAWYAFNSVYSKFWHNVDDGSAISASNTEWIKIDLGVKTPITNMLLDPRIGYVMSPKDYVLEGSDDNAIWNTITTVTSKVYTGIRSIHRYKSMDTTIANNRYYRLTIKKAEVTNTVAIERFILVNNISGSWNVADDDWLELTPYKPLNKAFTKTTQTWDTGYCNETGDNIDIFIVYEQNSGVGYLLVNKSHMDYTSAIGNVSGSSSIGSGTMSFTVRPFDTYLITRGGSSNTSIEVHIR